MDSPEQIPISFERKLPQLLTPDEIYQQADAQLLAFLSEDNRIERKPATTRMNDLAEYFSMWANTDPYGGLIVIGYRKDNILEGCLSFGQPKTNEIEKCGTTNCPDAKYESKRIPVVNLDGQSDYIILIRVYYREDKLVRIPSGKAFDRRADTKHEMSEEEAHEMEIEKGQVSFENEPCHLAYPSDFDLGLIDEYVEKYKENRNVLPDHSREEILKLTYLGKFVSRKFVPNNACALIFAKDPQRIFPGCKIRFLRFSGEEEHTGEKWNVEKDIPINTGSIPQQIYEAEKVLTAQIREFSRLEKDGRFYTAPEYPKNAWYEAIVNACVHRSYGQRNMNIFVKMFDDRLVIESPGGFPPFVTPENIYEMHQPRNPHIMNAMFFLDLVKCANEGTKRIRSSMAELKLPDPIFEEKQFTSQIVRVTLRNNVKQRRVWIDKDASSLVGETIWKTLNEHERRIVNYFAEYELVSVSDIQRLTYLSWPTVSKTLQRLKKRGIITDIRKPNKKRDPQARWTLIRKNQ